jgi:hypothetical protein
VITIGGIGALLLIQLLLSFALADGAYQIAGLQSQQRDLLREEEALGEHLEVLGSTQNLTANAEALGMVVSGDPMFLNVASGAVKGSHSKTRPLPDNLVANSLLDGTTVIDPDALAAAEAAEAASGDTGQSTMSGSSAVATSEPGLLPSPKTH